jgi:hypothetical protein
LRQEKEDEDAVANLLDAPEEAEGAETAVVEPKAEPAPLETVKVAETGTAAASLVGAGLECDFRACN